VSGIQTITPNQFVTKTFRGSDPTDPYCSESFAHIARLRCVGRSVLALRTTLDRNTASTMSVPAPLPMIVLPVRVRGMKLLVPSGPGHSLDFVRREAQAISRAENVRGACAPLRCCAV